jgi:ribosomal-protein-alanine N-acetyltransferase
MERANLRATEIQVREATPDDVETLLALQGEAPEAAQWSRESLQEASATHSGMQIFVALREAQAIGFVLFRCAGDEMEILNLAVRDGVRRQGVGTVLLRAALRQAGEKQTRRVFLEVRASNRVAQSFYLANGFEITGRRPDYYAQPKEYAVLMSRAVSSCMP